MSTRKQDKDAWKKGMIEECTKISSGKKNFTDERFWTLTRDKATGNGYAVIRFLPPHEDDSLPIVKYYTHSFKNKNNGQWYIENSRTSLGNGIADPCGELNSRLWDTGLESNQNIAREQKRKQVFISNILVIEDPENPQNEGKVFLYKYGKKIFNKINDVMNPDEYAKKHKGVKAFIPFDYDTGANFTLEAKMVNKFVNYDSSDFQPCTPVSLEDQAVIEPQLVSLTEFTEPSNFKTYEELKARLTKVLGENPHGLDMSVPMANVPMAKPQLETPAPVSEADSDLDEQDFNMEEFEELAQRTAK